MTHIHSLKSIAKRLTFPVFAVTLLALSSACTFSAYDPPDKISSSSGGRSTGGSSSGGTSSGGAPAEEGPVTEPFDKLVVQTVQWFDKDITIEKAETETETYESWLGGEYKERGHSLRLKVQNRTRFESNLGREHWDLFLADGTRLLGTTESNSFGPQDALFYHGFYEDGLGRSLDGAYLELNGAEYGDYKTLIIPLDAPVQKEPVLILKELEGQVFEADPETVGLRYEVLSARVSLNSDSHFKLSRGARAEVGKKLVELVVRTSTVNGDGAIRDKYYHLLVDGVGVSSFVPFNYYDPEEPIDVTVLFQIDEDATEFDAEFKVETKDVESWRSFHVDLANATPVE